MTFTFDKAATPAGPNKPFGGRGTCARFGEFGFAPSAGAVEFEAARAFFVGRTGSGTVTS